MPEPTLEAWAQIRHAYESTDTPIVEICFEHEITAPMLRYRVRLWDWKRRRATIPRRGPPEVEVFSLPPVGAANGGEGAGGESFVDASTHTETPPHPMSSHGLDIDLSPHAGRGKEDGRDEEEDIVPRLQGAVARVLPAIEATIARMASGSQHPRAMEQAGRTLSSLTRTLRELNGLLSEHNAQPGSPSNGNSCTCECHYDMPADMDAYREELTRKIEIFLASRGYDAFGEPKAGDAPPA